MKPMQLNCFFAFLAYGGNGGVATLLPEIAFWWAKVSAEIAKDERVGRLEAKKYGDVPLTMERNRMVREAKDRDMDVLVMIDSDNVPDLYDGVLNEAKPFWKTSFDFLYERKMRGVPSVIAAPYCGPPPHPVKGGCENVYCFHGEVMEGDIDKQFFKLTGYSREQAAIMRGIQPIAAGPTGCIMYSLDAFDVMPVHSMTQEEILLAYKNGNLPLERATRLLNMQSWFFYEYTNGEQTEKASTDDVTNTREIQLAGLVKYKEPIVFANWDAWAGHYKPKCVGKPLPVYVEQINDLYREAVEQNISAHDKLQDADFTRGLNMSNVLPADDEEVPLKQDDPESIVAPTEKQTQIWDDPRTAPEFADEKKQPASIVQWDKRVVNGRVVQSVGAFGGGQMPEEDLHALTEVVRLAARQRPNTPLRIVEVGSWVGESAIQMHAGFGPAGGTVFCVDTWEGSPSDMSSKVAEELGFDNLFAVFRDNVGDLLDKSIKVLRGRSVDVANDMEPQSVDVVFVDAEHTKEACRDDIRAWLRHLAPHGIMAGHDWCSAFTGVIEAVKEICDEAGVMPKLVNGSTVWFFTKKEYDDGLAKQQKARAKRKRKEPSPDGQPVAAS